MRAIVLAASVLAAALTAGATGSRAADLGERPYIYDRQSSPYDDPRYRDLYGPSRPYAEAPPAYDHPPPGYYRPAPTPRGYVYRDRPDDSYRPYPAPRRYSYAEPYAPPPVARACLHREEIKRRLVEEGWRDFRDVELRPDAVRVHARRPSGDLYVLRVDRCTGEIVNSRLLERGQYGPYAYGTAPRRYDRPYY